KGWGPGLCERRPDITMQQAGAFLESMYRKNADFVFTVSRDFVRQCQTPILVLPDDVPAHPYAVAIETVHLAPNAQVSLYPWKANPEQITIALRHVGTFLKANTPAAAAQRPMAAAAQQHRGAEMMRRQGPAPPPASQRHHARRRSAQAGRGPQ